MSSFDAIGVGSEDRKLLSSISSWSLGLAGVLGLLGVLALVSPWAAAGVVDAVCGFSLIAAGLSQLAMSAGTFTWRGFWIGLFCGGLSIVAGTGMLVLPKAGIEALVLFLGLVMLFEAVAKRAAAFTIRGGFPWGWLLVDGVVTGALAAVLLTCRPAEAGVLLGVFVGVNLLSTAFTCAAAGLWMRRADRLA